MKLEEFITIASKGNEAERYGDLYYMAPELFTSNCYDQRVDTWAVGVVLFVLITGKYPFWGKKTEEIIEEISFKKLCFDDIEC